MSTNDPKAGHIALFGYYNKRNFGDDLMGVIFGLHLQKLGVPFKVYGLRPDILERYGFAGTDDVVSLLDGARMVLHGGGGAFLPTEAGRIVSQEYEQELTVLLDECERRQLPIYMISVGGEGLEARFLSPARQRHLKMAALVTFRNPEDARALGQGVPHEVVDDIVWSTPRFFPTPARPPGRDVVKVVIDRGLYKSPRSRIPLRIAVFLSRLLGRRHDFSLFDTAYRPEIPPEKLETDGGLRVERYVDVTKFVQELSQADIVITNRLHMGMVVMSFGGVDFQLWPRPKARLVLNRYGLGNYTFPTAFSLFRFIFTVLSLKPGHKDEVFARQLEPGRRLQNSQRNLEIIANLVAGRNP